MPVCTSCDKENKVTTKFCIYCGKSLLLGKGEKFLQKEENASKVFRSNINSISTRLFITAIGISLAMTFFSVVCISYLKNQEEIVLTESELPPTDISRTDSLQTGEDIKGVKFKMIMAAVHFYATDSGIFKNVKVFIPNCKVNDYECLRMFCEENELTGVERMIEEWAVMKCETSNDLSLFRDRITDDLVKIKKYRKWLPSYKEYLQELDSLVAVFQSKNPASEKSQIPYNSVRPYKATSFNEYDMIIRLTWIAFLVGLSGIVLSIWFYFRRIKIVSSNFK